MVSAIIWQEWSSAILGRVASRIMDAGPRPPQLTLIEKRMDDEIMDRTTTVFSCKSRPVQILKHLSTESVMDFSRPAVDEPEWVSLIPSDSITQLSLAVKSDNVRVPVQLWDKLIAQSDVIGPQLSQALMVIRALALRWYHKKLTQDGVNYLRCTHGIDWHSVECKQLIKQVLHNLGVMREIVAHAANNEWFEYPAGSRLLSCASLWNTKVSSWEMGSLCSWPIQDLGQSKGGETSAEGKAAEIVEEEVSWHKNWANYCRRSCILLCRKDRMIGELSTTQVPMDSMTVYGFHCFDCLP